MQWKSFVCHSGWAGGFGRVGVAEQCVSDNCVPKNSKNFLLDFKRHSRNMTMRWHVTSLLICYDDDGQGQGSCWGGAGVIVPFAAITTKSIIHLYKLKAKNSPINDKHVVKCCHGHCCSPVRAATGALPLQLLLLSLSLLTFSLAN